LIHDVPFLLTFDFINLISTEIVTFIQVRRTPDLVIPLNDEMLLIDKYSAIIKTRQDLLKLSAEDRAEIKEVFNSEFRFFSCLQDNLKND
jgi:hypothetical protein